MGDVFRSHISLWWSPLIVDCAFNDLAIVHDGIEDLICFLNWFRWSVCCQLCGVCRQSVQSCCVVRLVAFRSSFWTHIFFYLLITLFQQCPESAAVLSLQRSKRRQER